MIKRFLRIFKKPVAKKTYRKAGHEELYKTIVDMERRYNKAVFAHNAYLAKELGVCERTIRRYLSRLQQDERIIITDGNGRRRKISTVEKIDTRPQVSYRPERKRGQKFVQKVSRDCPKSVRHILSPDPSMLLYYTKPREEILTWPENEQIKYWRDKLEFECVHDLDFRKMAQEAAV